MGDLVAHVRTAVDRAGAAHAWDQGEGLLLGLAAEYRAGRSIYPDIVLGPEVIDNYPPTYLLLMAAGDDSLEATLRRGRLISLAASLVAALAVAVLAALGSPGGAFQRAFGGIAAAGLFVALEPVRLWGGLARVDMFGLAAVMVGVCALRIRGAPGRVIALLFFVLALWTKQSLIAAPLALVVVIGARRPREALLWTSCALVMGLAGVFAMQRLTGDRFFFHVVTANQTAFSFDLLAHHLRLFVGLAAPLLPWVVLGLASARAEDARRRFLRVWLVFALFGLMSLGKTGSGTNYMLELFAILSVLAGTGLAGLADFARRSRRRALIASAVLVVIVAVHPPDLEEGRFSARLPRRDLDLEAGMAAVRAEVGRIDGDVVSWDMSLPVLAGKRLVYHPFVIPDLVRRGLFSDAALLTKIEAGELPLVVTSFDLDDAVRFEREAGSLAPMFTERVLVALRRRYQKERELTLPAHLGGAWVFYRPR